LNIRGNDLKINGANFASFENDYIEGRYGAIPYLGDIRKIIMDREEQ